MFMTKMVSALPQPAATATASATARSGACSLQPAACCNLPPAMQIEKMPKSRCKWSCRCVSRAASAFACLPYPLSTRCPLTVPLSVCPVGGSQAGSIASTQHCNAFHSDPTLPPSPSSHTLRTLTRCQYTIRISVGISPLVKFVVQVT